jgi:dienelactone hydrolase
MVEFPSALPDKTRLRAAWVAAAGPRRGSARRPAVILLHGCGGFFDGAGRLVPRTRRYAALLANEGWHVLALDSYGPRGERSVCVPKPGRRRITQLQRRRDTLGALAWLGRQPEVDAERIALLGWAAGGSTVLAATNAQHPEVKEAPRPPKAAVAFYPGCEVELRRSYAASARLLLLLGGADEAAPAEHCLDLVKADPAMVEAKVYDGASHGFDRVRTSSPVPGPTPGSPAATNAKVGAAMAPPPTAEEVAARRDSVQAVQAFLRRELGD